MAAAWPNAIKLYNSFAKDYGKKLRTLKKTAFFAIFCGFFGNFCLFLAKKLKNRVFMIFQTTKNNRLRRYTDNG